MAALYTEDKEEFRSLLKKIFDKSDLMSDKEREGAINFRNFKSTLNENL